MRRIKPSFLLSLALVLLFACGEGPADESAVSPQSETAAIRVGWQIPWATQGQVVQALKHTNVLDLHDLKAELKGFSYGGPLNEAALAGEVDVILTADQPAAMLLANGGEWTIVGRLMYNRVAVYVPPDSPIQTLSDLEGKSVAIPYGAAAQRDALKAIQNAGLDPARDIRSLNLDIYEQTSVVQAGSSESWGEIDALVGFDPTPAIFEQQGLARMLHVGRVVSLVLISNDYLASRSEAAGRFLEAFIEAWYYYARHQEEANAWFQEESRLDFDVEVLDIAASVEPNVEAQSIEDIRPLLNDEDLAILQEAATFIFQQGLAAAEVTMADHVDQSLMRAARERILSADYDGERLVASP